MTSHSGEATGGERPVRRARRDRMTRTAISLGIVAAAGLALSQSAAAQTVIDGDTIELFEGAH